MRELSLDDLALVHGGSGKEILFNEGRLAQGLGGGTPEPVCYPSPNMSTSDGPVYSDGNA